MLKTLWLALMAAPIMIVLDVLWVGLIANKYYRMQLGALYAPHLMVWPVVVFYVVYIFAIAYFVTAPALKERSLWHAALGGALLGLTAYGTYDLINLALTAHWPLTMSLVDIWWGVVVTTCASLGSYLIATKIFKF